MSAIETEERTKCVVCEHEDATPDPYFYRWQERTFWVYRCTECTHQFVHPPVTPEDQDAIYDDDYFSQEGDWVCGVFDASYIEAEPQLRDEAGDVLDMLPAPPGRLLDVGCAGGTFLDQARDHGFEVSGIELNPTMARYARRTYQLDVLNSRIEDVPEDRWTDTFDVVTVLDVLEHVPEPLAVANKVARWIRPGGTLLIRGPLSNSRLGFLKQGLRRRFQLLKRLPGYPLDANIFNKRSLEALLDISGFEVTEWIDETSTFANVVATRTAG